MKAAPPLVLVLGDWVVYFCSDEHKKVKPHFLKGEGIGQIPREFTLAARLSFVHSFMRSVNKYLVRVLWPDTPWALEQQWATRQMKVCS